MGLSYYTLYYDLRKVLIYYTRLSLDGILNTSLRLIPLIKDTCEINYDSYHPISFTIVSLQSAIEEHVSLLLVSWGVEG